VLVAVCYPSSYLLHAVSNHCIVLYVCSAYELLFCDTTTGRQITSATELRDVKWATWTCTLGELLGFAVFGAIEWVVLICVCGRATLGTLKRCLAASH
jgi:hypothetical protein